MYKSRFIYSFLFILLVSCSDQSTNKRMTEVIEEWQGKEFVLPLVMTDVLTGNEIDLKDVDFTILTYINSNGCTSCKMKLPLWKAYIDSLQSITDTPFKVLLVIQSGKKDDVINLLKRDSYDYPVFIDENDYVNHHNKLPDDPTFQTFILNKTFHVIAIGNPIYSCAIGDLYKSLISGGTILRNGSTDMIVVDNNLIDIGSMNPGENKIAEFTLSNHGNDTIFIRDIVTSCECTTVEFMNNYIQPRDKLTGKIVMNGDSLREEFFRTIHIFYDGFDYPTVINIRGVIK